MGKRDILLEPTSTKDIEIFKANKTAKFATTNKKETTPLFVKKAV